MTPDRTRHLVEAALADQGWAVYRLVLGGGPALAVRSGAVSAPAFVVAVARAAEPGSGERAYPRFERQDGADALASVDSEGEITYCEAEGRSEAQTLADLLIRTGKAAERHTPALPAPERVGRY
jgi:hypothetical protein